MIIRIFLAGLLTAVSLCGAAEARGRGRSETPEAMARLVLIDDAMIEADEVPSDDWRRRIGSLDADADDKVRLHLRLRPNRAMGRMSISF